jgi:hypothetical protein
LYWTPAGRGEEILFPLFTLEEMSNQTVCTYDQKTLWCLLQPFFFCPSKAGAKRMEQRFKQQEEESMKTEVERRVATTINEMAHFWSISPSRCFPMRQA